MIDRLRTHLASFIVKHLTRPRMVVVRSWLWLAAKSCDTQAKRRCLHAVLHLDPQNEPASLALLLFDQHRLTS